ncbi:hypothetical protein ASC97_30480 [Rhizobium sp. Root1203]|uniref:IclR family transcriptional regulator n=1 Tax=Rhizobium sp. Root1203 TaxID=1736427 RepID=UPI00070ADCB4|nr:IclR family transcriptional regulator [Rhizobium sp. Root1203]KQV17304.1 hypothetical protein ASC97_30480 [Rhizobium sp. Root1203]
MQQENRNPAAAEGTTRQSSADKAFGVLMALGDLGVGSAGGVRLSDLVAYLEYPHPTVHRLLGDLKKAGFVAQDPDSNRYRLGPKILLLSAQCLGGMDLRRIAQPIVSNLVEELGSTTHIGIREGSSIIYIDKFESLRSTRLGSSIGQRRKATTTALGKAILAFTDGDEVEAVLADGLEKLTPHSVTNADEFRKQLERVHARGWAIDDEECEIGIRCAAAPIFDYSSAVVAALSMSFIASQVSRKELEKHAKRVAAVASQISSELGYAARPPRSFRSGS